MNLQSLVIEAVREHNVLPLTGRCNLSCCFCSHRQNPPGARAYSFSPLNLSLLQELMPYLDPQKKIIIGESATRLREGEPLTHPAFGALLEELRKLFPHTLIQVTTNAALMNDETARLLAALAPLEVVLSLNSASEGVRRLLMSDPFPRRAINTPALLARFGVPFHGSVVALPHLSGWEDLRLTLQQLDDQGAKTLRMLLCGYTRCSDPSLAFPRGILIRCHELVKELQLRLNSPLLAEPPLVEDLIPVIEGVIRDTPATRAGLHTGDTVISVDGKKPASRVDAFQMAHKHCNPKLILSRHTRNIVVSLVKESGEAPGFVMAYDLDPGQVERVRNLLSAGVETIMLVSGAAYPRWRAAVELFGLEGLRPVAVKSGFFGGNIDSAGLLTSRDFRAVLEREASRSAFQQALLPALAFNSGGVDLAGEHYSALGDMGLHLRLME